MLIHDDAKSPMVVYRLEDRYGIGPYRSDLRYQRPAPRALGMTVARASCYRGHKFNPEPLLDFKQEELEAFWHGWQFGFERHGDAEQWFGERNLAALRMLGFKLCAIKARRVYRSQSGLQVMFVRYDGVVFDFREYMDGRDGITYNRRKP